MGSWEHSSLALKGEADSPAIFLAYSCQQRRNRPNNIYHLSRASRVLKYGHDTSDADLAFAYFVLLSYFLYLYTYHSRV